MAGKSKKLEFPNSNGENLAANLELPEGQPRAYALFAHCFSCSKDLAGVSRISRRLREKGVAILRFDFTGLGHSEGDFSNTNFSSNVDDLLSASAFLRQHYHAPSLLIGQSLGGAAVLSSAPQIPEAKAVVTIGAPSDTDHVKHLFVGQLDEIEKNGFAEVSLGGRKFKIKKQFIEDISENHVLKKVANMDKSLLIFHSPQDETVSIEHAAKIYMAAKHPKSFISLDGADHMLTNKEDSAYVADLISAWCLRYLN